jgi:CRP-like cAMP-binding protein
VTGGARTRLSGYAAVMTDGFDDLKTAIAALARPLPCDPAVLANLMTRVRPRRVVRGELLCRQGEPAPSMFYVRSGLLRYFYLGDDAEHTGQFFDAGMMVGDVFSMGGGETALQNIDVLEAGELLVVPIAALHAAYDRDHGLERFGRRLIEIGMIGSQRRTAALLQRSPEQRYDDFVSTRPEVARRVPLYLIASYLGITPEALSRIRRRRTRG